MFEAISDSQKPLAIAFAAMSFLYTIIDVGIRKVIVQQQTASADNLVVKF